MKITSRKFKLLGLAVIKQQTDGVYVRGHHRFWVQLCEWKAKTYFCPRSYFIIVITLGGIEKIKTKKKKKKWQQNSLNNHITAKIYLALQNLHFSPQKAP